jgi:hypothetical protein
MRRSSTEESHRDVQNKDQQQKGIEATERNAMQDVDVDVDVDVRDQGEGR